MQTKYILIAKQQEMLFSTNGKSQWLSAAKLWDLQCISNGDNAVLQHGAMKMHFSLVMTPDT